MIRSVMIATTTVICVFVLAPVEGVETNAPFAVAPFNAQTADDLQHETAVFLNIPVIRTIDLIDGIQIELILIPAGEFDMGSPPSEKARNVDEEPIRRIKISRPFYIGRYEITQAEWKAVMGQILSNFQGSDLPVDGIPWSSAAEFCQRLSEREHETFRLPTEAEWEYACRAGTVTTYSFGGDPSSLTQFAWYSGNSRHKTHPVGRKKPNAFGLYDMHGNVWEWCSDWYNEYPVDPIIDPTGPSDGSSRILRGGSWFCTLDLCRSANRGWNTPTIRDDDVGFRIVMDCPE